MTRMVLAVCLAACSSKTVILGGTLGAASVVATTLPPLPAMTNVVVHPGDDSAGIDFDPVDGAVDYRVYPLPSNADIDTSNGELHVKNAIYRCAGDRQTLDLPNSLDASDPRLAKAGSNAVIAATDDANTLGYVYLTAAAGLIPVYAVGLYAADNENGWRESRVKVYTTKTSERDAWLSPSGRDDGVAFYVPAQASDATQSVYNSQNDYVVAGQGWTRYQQYYFTSAGAAGHAADTPIAPTPVFEVLRARADGAVPLFAVEYHGTHVHVELAAGTERFHRAAYQGDGPLWHLTWSGLTAPTTLVVEALKSGCPFQGFLSPRALSVNAHQPFLTLAQMQSAAPNGEVFVNGQHDGEAFPQPIARAFVEVSPAAHDPAAWDWYQTFSTNEDIASVVDVGDCDALFAGFHCQHLRTTLFDITADRLDLQPDSAQTPQFVFTAGTILGQYYVAFDDSESDVPGNVHLTARQTTTVPASGYLHVTVSTDILATNRRYPQLIISDQGTPGVLMGDRNPDNTLLLQVTGNNGGGETELEMQAFHSDTTSRAWSIDDPYPATSFYPLDGADNVAWATAYSGIPLPPSDPLFEHVGVDRMTTMDAYVSQQRLYVLIDGAPVGCRMLPSDVSFAAPVSITFADVLDHEGAGDENVCNAARPFDFLHAHQCTETKRRIDDWGWKSGVPAPTWDEQRFPCLPFTP